VLCPNGTLEAVARKEPKTLDEMRGIDEVRRWQVEALGAELLGGLTA
jgi:hypothetical protein